MIKFVSKSLQDTQKFAQKFAKSLQAGQTVLLYGQMGSGKTTFSKEIIKNLGFHGVVTSPTFTLVNVYEAQFLVQHFDMYRIESVSEAYEVGIDEMLKNPKAINLVEWPENAKAILPENAIKVYVSILDENSREFCVEGLDD